MKRLSVLMPVYNESRTLRTIVEKVLDAPVDLEIELVCVDDGSRDDSLAILEELAATDKRITVIAQPENMGKGKAIRTAIENMTGDIGIVQDADLEYDPVDYPRVIGPIINGNADAVYGSRLASSEVRRVLFFWHSLGNKVLTMFSNMANDVNLTDMETCYKAVRSDVLKSLRLTCDRFGFEPEITARLAKSGARMYEVPISYHGRTYAEGKKVGWRDGVEALWLIFKFRFIDTKATTHPGHVTPETMSLSPAVSKWMLSNFNDYLGDDVLVAGGGMGNLTEYLTDRRSIAVFDIDRRHLESVEERLGHLDNVTINQGDFEERDFYGGVEPVDSVICVNVLEHLDKPETALEGFSTALRRGGHALILVPAHEWLYSAADQALGHRKRYETAALSDLLEDAGFEIITCYQFNRLGVFGWYANKLSGRTTIGKWQARLYDLMLPIARLLETFKMLPGLSVIAIARKN